MGNTKLNIDEVNKVFTIPLYLCGDVDNPPVFKFEELIGYELLAETQVAERFYKDDVSPQYLELVFRTLTRMFDVNTINLEGPCSCSLILYLTNPCWSKVTSSAGTAGHKSNIKYLVGQHLENLQIVTAALLEMMGYNANDGSSRVNGTSADEELMKFKELLNGGVITQEEFDEKERQLLET